MKLFYGNISPEVLIDPDEQMHIIKVLRMKNGDKIFLTDGEGQLVKGNLLIEGKKVSLQNIEIQPQKQDFQPSLHIAIAPTKNMDRIEFFIEKATEMGISEITFLQTDNSERKNLNLDKIQKQVVGASKQSLRTYFPKVNDLIKFKDFIKTINPETSFVAHCDESLERIRIQEVQISEKWTVFIGPEGDFSTSEIQQLSELGIKAITLGEQRLRTETAGIYVASWNYSKM